MQIYNEYMCIMHIVYMYMYTLYNRMYDFLNLHENKTLYNIMLCNKSLIMDIFILLFLSDGLIAKLAYLSFKIYL